MLEFLCSGETRVVRRPRTLHSRPRSVVHTLIKYGYVIEREKIITVVTPSTGGGGGDHSILNDTFFSHLYDDIRAGKYLAIFAAPPCSTYSVARYFSNDTGDGGPPPVRSRSHILGPYRASTSASSGEPTRLLAARAFYSRQRTELAQTGPSKILPTVATQTTTCYSPFQSTAPFGSTRTSSHSRKKPTLAAPPLLSACSEARPKSTLPSCIAPASIPLLRR